MGVLCNKNNKNNKIILPLFTSQNEAKVWINKLMDHSTDLEADCVINDHLKDIEGLVLDLSPKGLGLSSRYAFGIITLHSTIYDLYLYLQYYIFHTF